MSWELVALSRWHREAFQHACVYHKMEQDILDTWPSASPAPTKPIDPNSLAGFLLFFFMIPRLSIPL